MDIQYVDIIITSINKNNFLINMSFHLLEIDVSEIISSLPLIDLFENIIRKTSFGWDQVTQSLVQLGVILMDLAVPSASSGKVSGENIMCRMNFIRTIELTNNWFQDTIRSKKGISITTNMVKDLGTKILLEMFKVG